MIYSNEFIYDVDRSPVWSMLLVAHEWRGSISTSTSARKEATMMARYFALTALLASTLALGCSSGAENPQAAGKKPQYCTTVIDKLQPGQTESEIISHECSDTEQDANTFAADGKKLIIVWYEDEDYGGASQRVFGKAGDCDRDGYGINNVGRWDDVTWPFGGWNDDISSFKTDSYCNHVAAYENENYGGRCKQWHDPDAKGLGIKNVGHELNDLITSFRLVRGAADDLCL